MDSRLQHSLIIFNSRHIFLLIDILKFFYTPIQLPLDSHWRYFTLLNSDSADGYYGTSLLQGRGPIRPSSLHHPSQTTAMCIWPLSFVHFFEVRFSRAKLDRRHLESKLLLDLCELHKSPALIFYIRHQPLPSLAFTDGQAQAPRLHLEIDLRSPKYYFHTYTLKVNRISPAMVLWAPKMPKRVSLPR